MPRLSAMFSSVLVVGWRMRVSASVRQQECRDAGDEKVKGHKFALQEKNILEFICGNNIRYECIENKASPRELSVLKQCQDKTFPDVTIEHFFNFICDFTSESVERQTEQWAECVAENSKVSRIVKGIPGYLMECTNLGQSLTPVSQAVKDFFCEQPVRYQCIQRAVSQATLIKMAECSDLTEEMILSKLCSTGTSEWVNKWTECITIATQDIDLKMLCL
ncbi:uncharacterized protein LOC143239147 [Tachypleus tridentatus]|uniref:uncharacterized protein LOC143239147 n=1 Tax=Tachypleus tridentatus TaxID=6853 RepID=UPI003FD1466E